MADAELAALTALAQSRLELLREAPSAQRRNAAVTRSVTWAGLPHGTLVA